MSACIDACSLPSSLSADLPCCIVSSLFLSYAKNGVNTCSVERHDASVCTYDDQTANFNQIKSTITSLKNTQTELDVILTDIMGMLGVTAPAPGTGVAGR